MKFLCVIDSFTPETQKRYALLEEACRVRNFEFVLIESEKYDFVRSVPGLKQPYMLFRIAPGEKARTVEKDLLRPHAATFYSSYSHGLATRSYSFFYKGEDTIPFIPTIPDLPTDKKQVIKYVKKLGGFPIIVKVMGRRHGVGIIKIDSMESLISTADFLATQHHFAVLRKYIPHKRQGRLIVVGDQVIASHANIATHDFRTNFGENTKRKRKVMTFSPEIKQQAVNAVLAMGLEFAGVDVLMDERDGQAYISEVNFPCYFPTTQELTGIDIAGKMVDHLYKKALTL